MLNLTQLEAHMAAYPDTPPRTTALEQGIRIGTGFHRKWYRSQRDHMLGWIVVQECQARAKGRDPAEVDAMGMWSRLKCSPSMFWLAECAGVHVDLLDRAEDAAVVAATIRPMDGDPHGRMMRETIPWEVVRGAILAGPKPAQTDQAAEDARESFERLTGRVSAYRHLRKWLA